MNIRPIQPRRARITLVGLAVAALAVVAAPQSAGAYPPQPPNRSIVLDAAGQICNAEVPYISYEISTEGYEPSEVASLTATVTIIDSTGNVASGPFTGQPLVGEVLYPGAEVDGAGKGIDWPGWDFVGGVWVPDSSDAHLRSGLLVEATVESSTVTGAVQYPAESQVCMSPVGQSPPPGGAVGGVGGVGITGTLPDTGGSDPTRIVWIAVVALLAGGVILAASQRRNGAADARS